MRTQLRIVGLGPDLRRNGPAGPGAAGLPVPNRPPILLRAGPARHGGLCPLPGRRAIPARRIEGLAPILTLPILLAALGAPPAGDAPGPARGRSRDFDLTYRG